MRGAAAAAESPVSVCDASRGSSARSSQAGCVHVETCVGQCEGGFRLDPVAETEFVHAQCTALRVPFKIVAFVNLSDVNAEVAVKKHLARSEHVAGVRMITNFVHGHPEWTYPQVSPFGGATVSAFDQLPLPPRASQAPHSLCFGCITTRRWSATTGGGARSLRLAFPC